MAAKISFIGAGNMANAIIGGLIKNHYPAKDITATCPDDALLDKLAAHYSINTGNDNLKAAMAADVIILAVKPQIMRSVCEPLTAVLKTRVQAPLVISIAAGIPLNALNRWLGDAIPIVRAMPNTPAMIGKGATSLYASPLVDDQQKSAVESIVSATGLFEWLDDEDLMDAATAVAGSAPAYFFLLFSAMEQAAVDQGLPQQTARRLAIQTGLGAAAMALESDETPEQLMRNVMSPQGSTEQAIAVFEDEKLRDIVTKAMQACAKRAKQMQSEFADH